jgi:hypothetical protein
MLDALTPEVRRELAAARVAALHRSAMPAQAGPLRRAVASGLVRLGLRLGYDGSVPPLVSQPASLAHANVITLRIPSCRSISSKP